MILVLKPVFKEKMRGDLMGMKYPIFNYGSKFEYQGRTFCTIGTDVCRNEIECQTLPFDGNYYWFKVSGNANKVRMI